MQITARDIREMNFAKSFKGFDIEEVKNFLEMVAGEYEKIVYQNNELKEDIHRLEKELQDYRDKNDNLNKILITAQSFAENEKKRVEKELELKYKEAELNIKKMIDETVRQKVELEMEIKELLTKKNSFMRKMKNFFEEQLKQLEDMDKEIEFKTLENRIDEDNAEKLSEEDSIVVKKNDIFEGKE